MTVRTRFAPSPTGSLHIGNVRSGLFAYLYARHHHGQFVLRIDDTDRERSTKQSLEEILADLKWLGMEWDEGPPDPEYFQTNRVERHREAALQTAARAQGVSVLLLGRRTRRQAQAGRARASPGRFTIANAAGSTSPPTCRCPTNPRAATTRFVSRCRSTARRWSMTWSRAVWCFRIPSSTTSSSCVPTARRFTTSRASSTTSTCTSRISFAATTTSRTRRARCRWRTRSGSRRRPSHICRRCSGPTASPLSKRHGATSVIAYRENGYFPEAMLNYLARLGWSHGDQEIFSKDELIDYLRLRGVREIGRRLQRREAALAELPLPEGAADRRSWRPRSSRSSRSAGGRFRATTRGWKRRSRRCMSAPRRWSSWSDFSSFYREGRHRDRSEGGGEIPQARSRGAAARVGRGARGTRGRSSPRRRCRRCSKLSWRDSA